VLQLRIALTTERGSGRPRGLRSWIEVRPTSDGVHCRIDSGGRYLATGRTDAGTWVPARRTDRPVPTIYIGISQHCGSFRCCRSLYRRRPFVSSTGAIMRSPPLSRPGSLRIVYCTISFGWTAGGSGDPRPGRAIALRRYATLAQDETGQALCGDPWRRCHHSDRRSDSGAKSPGPPMRLRVDSPATTDREPARTRTAWSRSRSGTPRLSRARSEVSSS
jgi:hypothetical protein